MEKLDRRDLRFVLVCLAVIAAGAAVTASLFRRAFPEASIEFREACPASATVMRRWLSKGP